MSDLPEPEFIEGWPISMSAFIQLRDADGGDIIVNVREITAVLGLVGKALVAAPDGAKSKMMLRGGVNLALTATIEEIAALLSAVAIFAGGEPVEQVSTTGFNGITDSPRLYTPDSER